MAAVGTNAQRGTLQPNNPPPRTKYPPPSDWQAQPESPKPAPSPSQAGPAPASAPQASSAPAPAQPVQPPPRNKPASYQPTSVTPPPVMREFRATWVPTVGNSCWPSKPGLTTAEQQAELIAILDRAQQLKLNAVIFQVRPACDALYRSDIEPWSEYLTGIQGRAPSPYYDPLEFAIKEAHKRGLELHAWFNPYRARHKNAKSPIAENHISKTRRDLVRDYGDYLWLDPGEREVQDYSTRVILDVVRRYDIDGVHFDDYFYPYEEKDRNGRDLDFPDARSWQKYGVRSGLTRDDWRRQNVDQFIQRMGNIIHAEKSWVKFGLSPFGIWRPKNPATIRGYDPYEKLYADSRKWLVEGWCDYLSPQLYWAIDPPEQSFPVLLNWWQTQNPKKRYVWPGINTLKVGTWPVSELTNQITYTRRLSNTPGHIHWSQSALMRNGGLATTLANDTYRAPALIPRFYWLDMRAPNKPDVRVVLSGDTAGVKWSSTNSPALWVLQTKQFGDWKTQILPAAVGGYKFDMQPELIAVSAVDRCGNQSAPAVVGLEK